MSGCRMGYLWLTALPLCPASSVIVNEKPSLTQLADTQGERQREDLTVSFLFYKPVFTYTFCTFFSHPEIKTHFHSSAPTSISSSLFFLSDTILAFFSPT